MVLVITKEAKSHNKPLSDGYDAEVISTNFSSLQKRRKRVSADQFLVPFGILLQTATIFSAVNAQQF